VKIFFNKPAAYFYTSFFMLLALIMISAWIPRVSALEKTNEYKSKSELNKKLNEKIDFIHSEIIKIKQELQWLSSKIKKMETFKQFVPEKMYNSIKFKKNKIKILTTLEQELAVLLKSGLAREMQQKTRIVQTGIAKTGAAKTAVKSENSKALIEQKIKKFGLIDWLEVIQDQDSLRMENRLPILFASANSTIAKEYNSFLKNLSCILKGSRIRVFVDGHADHDPINTEKYPSNFELGATRAANVVHALVKNGMNPSVFKIGSTGQYRFPEHKASKWKTLERHVNITVVFKL